MTYLEKVKKAKVLVNRLRGLEKGETLKVRWNKKEKDTFTFIRFSDWTGEEEDRGLSIDAGLLRSMNVDKIGGTTITFYDFDVFSNRHSVRIPLEEFTIIEEQETE